MRRGDDMSALRKLAVVRLCVRPMPTPAPRHMAALERERAEQRDYRITLERWRQRHANALMNRIARSLGWRSAMEPPT